MKIKTYRYEGDKRTVSKSIGSADHTIEDALWLENTSMIDPTFTFNSIDDSANIINENYVFIPEWGRYYFITNLEYQEGGVIALSCHVDVLMTYKDDIKKSSQMVARQEKLVDNELADSLFPIYEKQSVSCKSFGEIPAGYSVLLLTTGSADATEGGVVS